MNHSSVRPPTGEASGKLRAGLSPIEGYVLKERIGRGGFGEVWKCSAPGGMEKAIKFVFGHHDDVQAARELRSLERIRSIRHPFLLTLERFEIVGNRLVVVTELADGSLEDVYAKHREAGSCGIPRVTLLKYLTDTADGLDYLHQEFGLQHLDIKPANLLMIGGHVKVADFGLLKDLGEVDCSMIGGLTPIYAPPELFDGRPSPSSDQYSLAVMYQELLTGTRPFAGRTIAQLATQHVHSTPNLEPLPARDQAIVARALEKKPERRFKTCGEFIDQLRRGLGEHPVPTAVQKKVVVGSLPSVTDTEADENRTGSKALVVALGGTGADCLAGLRDAALAQYPDMTIDGVLIDTDANSLRRVEVEDRSKERVRIRRLFTALKTPSQYRRDAASKFRSISRRWIYNVSRGGETQGLRPMGRLALLDHSREVVDMLTETIRESATGSAEPLKIFVVGSINGGTGSGMYLDVVHVLQSLLDNQQYANAEVISLLSCEPFAAGQESMIATHNAHAALIEIAHFMSADQSYPGDTGAGFASVPAARSPLRNLYLISGSHQSRYGCRPVQTIVKYICQATHDAASILQAARRSVSANKGFVKPSVRSVGLASLCDANDQPHQRLVHSCVAELLASWLGTPRGGRAKAGPLAQRLSRRIGLGSDALRHAIRRSIDESSVGGRMDPVVIQGLANGIDQSAEPWSHIAAGIGNQLFRELSIAMGHVDCDLSTLITTVGLLQDECLSACQTGEEPSEVELPEVALPEGALQSVVQQVVVEIEQAQQRLECLAAVIAVATVEVNRTITGREPWDEFKDSGGRNRDQLMIELHQSHANAFMVRPLNDFQSHLDAPTMIERLSRSIHDKVVQTAQRLSSPTTMGGPQHPPLEVNPSDTSTMAAAPADNPNADSISPAHTNATMGLAGMTPVVQKIETIEDAYAMVRPPLLEFGGSQRLILLVGSDAKRDEMQPKVQQLHGAAVSVAVREGVATTLIQEAQEIDLAGLIARLEVVGGDPQITKRLASRNDVSFE